MPSSLHVVVPTHTPRYLDLVLVALWRQTRRPDTVVVSSDTDDDSIGELIDRWAVRLSFPVWWVRRPHMGGERLCQVRNNGVRHLTQTLGKARGRLVIFDGDMLPADDALQRHQAHTTGDPRTDPLVYPYRIDLDEHASGALSADKLHDAQSPPTPTHDEITALRTRDRRYAKHVMLRRLGLGARHKPKLLGGHFSCPLPLYLALNGFDELYQGWGFKDDEFAYRAARVHPPVAPRPPVRPACAEIIAFHLHHQTRQPDAPMASLPTAQRFARRRELPIVAEHGVRNPLPQPEPRATAFGPPRF